MVFVQLCVRSMSSLETIGPLMTGMKCRPDMAGLACEALNRMFQREQTELVAQVSCEEVSHSNLQSGVSLRRQIEEYSMNGPRVWCGGLMEACSAPAPLRL